MQRHGAACSIACHHGAGVFVLPQVYDPRATHGQYDLASLSDMVAPYTDYNGGSGGAPRQRRREEDEAAGVEPRVGKAVAGEEAEAAGRAVVAGGAAPGGQPAAPRGAQPRARRARPRGPRERPAPGGGLRAAGEARRDGGGRGR
uniref:Uncharacterized protein n=1 Tax=Aegilops tauschii subsp. strangulata TaxID=200361 RepID=A0A453NNW1_AEGTS